jgi:hypothetical protein
MKHSEFARAVADEFGALGGALVRDLVLDELGMTAQQALAAGSRPRDVWVSLCRAMDVPPTRIPGAGRPEPKG